MASFSNPAQLNFRVLGASKCAVFVKMDDLDDSLAPLTSLFVRQAFSVLCDFADTECEGGRLPVPVRFMLDDFANLSLPGFDRILSVVRSREISCTAICQTVSQLEARYGEAEANSIIGTATASSCWDSRTKPRPATSRCAPTKTPSSLLETPRRQLVVLRARQARRVRAGLRARESPRLRGVHCLRAHGDGQSRRALAV